MNGQSNPLDQLPPIILPEAISWWPLAIGWWIVIILSVFIALVLSIYCVRSYKAKVLKRAATHEGQQLYQAYLQTNDSYDYIAQYNQLLRRFCLQQFPNVFCASLSGDAWLQQLDKLAGKNLYQSSTGRQLLTLYQAKYCEDIDVSALNALLNQWLKQVKIKQTMEAIS